MKRPDRRGWTDGRDVPRRNGCGVMTKTTTPKKIGAAVDDECSQDDEKDNCGDEGPPVIFGAPWIGPSAIVVRATSAFKVWLYHIRFLLSYRQNVFSLCRVPIPMKGVSGRGRSARDLDPKHAPADHN